MLSLVGTGPTARIFAAAAFCAVLASACRTGFVDSLAPGAPASSVSQAASSSSRTDPAVFTLVPTATTVVTSTSKALIALNGTAPYTYAMVNGGGAVDAQGNYSAPGNPGSALVSVTDSLGRVAISKITINPPLSISAQPQYVLKNVAYQLPLLGGVPPYNYQLGDGSVGEVTSDGSYFSTVIGKASVTIGDSTGASGVLSLTVYNPLQIATDKIVTVVTSPVQLSATGGVPPYAYFVKSGNGAIDNSQKYLSSDSGQFPFQDEVCVSDAVNNENCQSVQIVSTITIKTVGNEIAVGNALDLSIFGGVPPFTFQETTIGGALGTLSPSACAQPGSRCSNFKANVAGTATILVTDYDNTSNQISIKIDPMLSISPATINLPTSTAFTYIPVGGVPPFSFKNSLGTTMLGGTLTTPSATSTSFTVTVTDAVGNTAISNSSTNLPADWPGIGTVTTESATSVLVTWFSSTAATNGFTISWAPVNCTVTAYNTCQAQSFADSSSSDPNYNGVSYLVTGLSPNTEYEFGVIITPTGTDGGGGSSAIRQLAGFTGNITVIHMGWNDVQATGKVDPSPGSGLAAVNPKVRIGWNPMQPSDPGATITGYNIYRGLSAGAETVFPLNSVPIPAGAPTFTDTSTLLYPATPYFYVVKPIVDGLEVGTSGNTNPSEIKIVVPPDNMVLVHRWIANQSMCAMLGETPNPLANYSCAFAWPSGNSTNFDVASGTQTGFFMDAYESGCNYARGSCANTGSTSKDCIGLGAPGALGITSSVANAVYYDRLSGTCSINTSAAWSTGGASWVEAAAASSANFYYMISNYPGLPPLAMIPQNQAAVACQALQRTLPTRGQQVAAGEWPTSNAAAISTLELGGGSNCNTDKAHGIAYETAVIPNNLETLPFAIPAGKSAPNAYTLRTGSNTTATCASRFGVQDLVGNANEWAADQVFCSSSPNTFNGVQYSCAGSSITLNTQNSDFTNLDLANTNGGGASGTGTVLNDFWNLSQSQTLLAPLMLPVLTSASYPNLAPSSLSLGANQFRFYGATSPGTRGILTGGAWYGADTVTGPQGAGRFSLDLSHGFSQPDSSVGFRCAQPVN